MKRPLISLLLTIGIITGAYAGVCPENLPSHQSFLSAEKEIADSLYNPTAPNYQDDRDTFAVIELDSFAVEGYSEPFYVYAVVDLNSDRWICIIAPENAYIGDFRDIQFPTGLKEYFRTVTRDGISYIQKRDSGGWFGRDRLISEQEFSDRTINSKVGKIKAPDLIDEYSKFGRGIQRSTVKTGKEVGYFFGDIVLGRGALGLEIAEYVSPSEASRMRLQMFNALDQANYESSSLTNTRSMASDPYVVAAAKTVGKVASAPLVIAATAPVDYVQAVHSAWDGRIEESGEQYAQATIKTGVVALTVRGLQGKTSHIEVGTFKGALSSQFRTFIRDGEMAKAQCLRTRAHQETTVSQARYMEYKALRAQGCKASDAHALMKLFDAGVNPGEWAFHFTTKGGGTGILADGSINSGMGLAGRGVYAGTTPTPSWLLKYGPTPGWGLTPPKPVRIPIQISSQLNPIRPLIPFKGEKQGTATLCCYRGKMPFDKTRDNDFLQFLLSLPDELGLAEL